MSRRSRSGGAFAAVLLGGLALVPSAFAGRIDYVVPPSPTGQYSVVAEGNGNGIVKVTYNACATAGQPYVLPLNVSSRGPVKAGATADWKVIKDGAADLAFDPTTVPFGAGTTATKITITPTQASASGARLRIKLDGSNGSGLGEGPGIMVTFACVLAPAPPVAPGACPATTRAKPVVPPGQAKKEDPVVPPAGNGNGGGNGNGNNGNGNGNGGPVDPVAPAPGPVVCTNPGTGATAPPAPEITVPTAGTFPRLGSPLTASSAQCVATARTIRAVAGELVTVRVVVLSGGVRIFNSAVRLTTPDGTVTKRSNHAGVVVFRVRPTKGGRLTVQSDACFGVRTVRVAPPRVVSRTVPTPQFTG